MQPQVPHIYRTCIQWRWITKPTNTSYLHHFTAFLSRLPCIITCILIMTSLPHYVMTSSSSSDDLSLKYEVQEELTPGSVIGNIISDSGLARLYGADVLSTLRFSFLTQPSLDRQYFTIDEATGDVITAHRIDREKLCPRRNDCSIKHDIAVQPIQYFQIVKVKSVIIRNIKKDNIFFKMCHNLIFTYRYLLQLYVNIISSEV